jgi:hypothetical protein
MAAAMSWRSPPTATDSAPPWLRPVTAILVGSTSGCDPAASTARYAST